MKKTFKHISYLSIIFSVLLVVGCTQKYKVPEPTSDLYNDFPVPGRLDGTTSFSSKKNVILITLFGIVGQMVHQVLQIKVLFIFIKF